MQTAEVFGYRLLKTDISTGYRSKSRVVVLHWKWKAGIDIGEPE